ncbi:MAG: hypothetical protein GWP91_14010, partial [Rhodobacterales bacterium]|nr:hypothetical protein [Rhodobacterales bacterium]
DDFDAVLKIAATGLFSVCRLAVFCLSTCLFVDSAELLCLHGKLFMLKAENRKECSTVGSTDRSTILALPTLDCAEAASSLATPAPADLSVQEMSCAPLCKYLLNPAYFDLGQNNIWSFNDAPLGNS